MTIMTIKMTKLVAMMKMVLMAMTLTTLNNKIMNNLNQIFRQNCLQDFLHHKSSW